MNSQELAPRTDAENLALRDDRIMELLQEVAALKVSEEEYSKASRHWHGMWLKAVGR